MSRQPPPLPFAGVLGKPPLPGFVEAQSPAAAAQFRVEPLLRAMRSHCHSCGQTEWRGFFPARTFHLLGILGCIALLGCGGCLPLGTKVTAGQKYTRESLAFLDLPGTTRAEVVATLGLPTYEAQEARTLVYVWEEAFGWGALETHTAQGRLEWKHPHVETGNGERWAVLIAYNEQGLVCAHSVRRLEQQTVEAACAAWSAARRTRQGGAAPP